ncbi:MAG: hypothetical protein OEW34_07870 [Burkholderiaceae bacterium]|jgi:adenylate cyclase|nr:hypothetical protein [Burkholderiaceae bacterium]
MSADRIPRRLVAVLAADIAGYSRLMGEDDVATVRALKGHQAVVLPLVAEFGGRIIDTAGDGILAEFQSAVSAVECASRIQHHMAQRNDGVDEHRRMQFRIGINLGEVIYDEARIYGDGINIAARLENLTQPGSICVSGKVKDEVEGKLELRFADLGVHELKNIAKPVQVYALTAAVGAPGHASLPKPPRAEAPSGPAAAASAPVRPVLLAVLPFRNATSDDSIEYLCDGITESLINRLSSVDVLRVISRTSAFAFKGKKMSPKQIGRKLGVDALVVGSLGQRGQTLAISAELMSIRDDTQLWGDRYSRSSDDMLQVEGDIATTIATALSRRLSGADKGKLAHAATTDPEAYRLYLKGRSFMVGNQQEMDKGIACFQQAIERAPDYAMAHAGLAEAYTVQAYLRAQGRAEAVGKARAAVTRALELDPELAEAHAALGAIRLYFEWDWSGAEVAFRRALELNPGSQAAIEAYGYYLLLIGHVDQSLVWTREAARLDPLSTGPVHNLGIAALVQGQNAEAAAEFRRAIDIDPNWTWGYIKLARALALQGLCEEALAQAEIGETRIAGGVAPLCWSWLGAVYALCGDATRARGKLEQLHALARKQYVDPAAFATVHGALGEVDEALGWYEKAFTDRTPNMVYAAIMPGFSPELVGSAHFQEIVERMGLPKPAR